jgi:WD40 repeat protein
MKACARTSRRPRCVARCRSRNQKIVFDLQLANLPVQKIDLRLAGHTLDRCAAAFGNTARLWNVHTGQPVGTLMKHGGPVWAVAFDSRGRFLATGSVDGTARLWKAHTGEPVGEPMQHGGPVWAVAFDPRGKLLATGSLDNAARLWLALSAQTLFERGREILGPESELGIVSSSLNFLSWVQNSSANATEYARSFLNTAEPLDRVLSPPQDATSGSVVVAK